MRDQMPNTALPLQAQEILYEAQVRAEKQIKDLQQSLDARRAELDSMSANTVHKTSGRYMEARIRILSIATHLKSKLEQWRRLKEQLTWLSPEDVNIVHVRYPDGRQRTFALLPIPACNLGDIGTITMLCKNSPLYAVLSGALAEEKSSVEFISPRGKIELQLSLAA